ncbi:MAG: hypothetical protein ABSD61_11775 [Terracidiphilus sp.]|jgi:hypothetical protein
MKSVVRMFALLVAIAGLAAASFAPATTPTLSPLHVTMSESGPGPLDIPAPPPCTADGTCLVQTASNR